MSIENMDVDAEYGGLITIHATELKRILKESISCAVDEVLERAATAVLTQANSNMAPAELSVIRHSALTIRTLKIKKV